MVENPEVSHQITAEAVAKLSLENILTEFLVRTIVGDNGESITERFGIDLSKWDAGILLDLYIIKEGKEIDYLVNKKYPSETPPGIIAEDIELIRNSIEQGLPTDTLWSVSS